jgi:hypothetical protein
MRHWAVRSEQAKKVPVSFNSVHPRITRVRWHTLIALSRSDSIVLTDHIKGLSLPSSAETKGELDPADSISC